MKPDVRLAVCGPLPALAKALAPYPNKPALLVSYYYLAQFQRQRHLYSYRDWVLDSGAFSAFASGVTIRLPDYIDAAKRLRDTDSKLVEVYALDVIGDWRGSLRNTERMWAAGVEAIPCYHMGEPWDVLVGMARDYPKIALGGMVGTGQAKTVKLEWMGQCFARVWPKRIHGFGQGSRDVILSLPFHSTDATNWESGPQRFGNWQSLGKGMGLRGGNNNLRAEVEHYLKLEREAARRWAREMRALEAP